MGKCLILFLLTLGIQGAVFAEIPGTARSNERDILRLDASLATASPAPGVGFGATVLRTFRPAHAYGLAVNVLHHGPTEHYDRVNTQAYDAVWEYSLALLEGFHALRIRGGLGVANSYIDKDNKPLVHKDEVATRHVWCAHMLASLAIDMPIADLMWFRAGLGAQKAFAKDAPVQSAVFLGVVFGGQWIGVGD